MESTHTDVDAVEPAKEVPVCSLLKITIQPSRAHHLAAIPWSAPTGSLRVNCRQLAAAICRPLAAGVFLQAVLQALELHHVGGEHSQG